MSTYEFANPTFAESTVAKFEDLKPCRINTYIKPGGGMALSKLQRGRWSEFPVTVCGEEPGYRFL